VAKRGDSRLTCWLMRMGFVRLKVETAGGRRALSYGILTSIAASTVVKKLPILACSFKL
jgi:hypothetical protein